MKKRNDCPCVEVGVNAPDNAITATGVVAAKASYDPHEGKASFDSLELEVNVTGSLSGGLLRFAAAVEYTYPCDTLLTAKAGDSQPGICIS